MLRSPKCPNCGANLNVGRHDLITTCPFCKATVKLDPDLVEVERFREAHATWNDPRTYVRTWTTVGDSHWILGPKVAAGETGDVWAASRARLPTEGVLLRIARDPADNPRVERAVASLRRLHQSRARGAELAPRRIPELVTRGMAKDRAAVLTRIARRHPRTLAGVALSPVQSVWVWRRILEILAFLHESGVAHGAITPHHVLVEAGEHGARLVGFGNAGEPGEALAGRDARYTDLYEETLSYTGDVRMSARMIRARIAAPPADWAALLDEVAAEGAEAWALRERVGRLAERCFGPPRFCPLLPR